MRSDDQLPLTFLNNGFEGGQELIDHRYVNVEVWFVDQENSTGPKESRREAKHQEHLLLARGEFLDRVLVGLPGFGRSLHHKPSVLSEASDMLAPMRQGQVDEPEALLEPLRLPRLDGQKNGIEIQ
jgi:hypothetical protein